MDIRGFFIGSKKEKGEDDSFKKKRFVEEGVNLIFLLVVKVEILVIVEIWFFMGCLLRWSDVLYVVWRKKEFVWFFISICYKWLF